MNIQQKGTLKCPHCKRITNYYYASVWGETEECDHCKKMFRMKQIMIGEKIK